MIGKARKRDKATVDPGVLALAGKWALGEESERVERGAAGKWRTKGRGVLPEWLARAGSEDDEPINHEMYAAAARLSVLAQADRSNRRLETQLLLAARTAAKAERRAEARRGLRAIKRTRASLEPAQRAVAGALAADRGTAPLLFTAEDFLACLLITDSLPPATAEQWFPATVKSLVRWQDMDGGLKTDQYVTCHLPGRVGDWREGLKGCRCERYVVNDAHAGSTRVFTPRKQVREEARQGQAGGRPDEQPAIERQYCPDYKSFCSRDRVFCTAAAVAALLADTPYRAGMFKAAAAPGKRR